MARQVYDQLLDILGPINELAALGEAGGSKTQGIVDPRPPPSK